MLHIRSASKRICRAAGAQIRCNLQSRSGS